MKTDFLLDNHGSLVILRPMTKAAKAWVEEHIPTDAPMWGHGVAIETRYVQDIVNGIAADGLSL